MTEHIDAVGAPDITTDPPVEPTIPTIANLLPASVRRVVYAIAPVLLLVVAFFDLPSVVEKATLLLNAAGFGVAFANVPKRTR